MFSKAILSKRYLYSRNNYLKLNELQLETKNQIENKIDQGIYQEKVRNCALCGFDSFLILAEQDRYGLPVSTVLCKKCGFLQTNPCLRNIDYIDFYQNYYRKLYTGKLNIPNKYFSHKLNLGKEQFDFIVNSINLPNDSLVLEVGCGSGATLYNFLKNGYKVLGLDYDKQYLEAGKLYYCSDNNFDLCEGDIHNLNFEEKPKLIIYSHVLEHIFDINKELDKIKEILSEDGYLFIEVPGVKNLKEVYYSDFLRYLQNAHLYHFTLQTLTYILQKHGFKLVTGDNYIRAIYQKGTGNKKISSDYQEIKKYLKSMENYYLFVISNKKIIKSILKQMGLLSIAHKLKLKIRSLIKA